NIKQHTNMQQKKFSSVTHREPYSTVNRVMPLFSQTIFTISVSCSAVKVCVLPPRCGSLSVLQNTNTVSTLYSIDMQYYSTQGKYISYLFSILKVLMMAATVKRLIFGWTLWPASLMLKPWLSTWSTTAARISFELSTLLLLSPPPPLPSSPCPSHSLPPPCPPHPPPPCPPTPPPPSPSPSCPPLPPPHSHMCSSSSSSS